MNWIIRFDQLSYSPTLYVKNTERFNTLFGVILTLLTGIAIITLSIYFIIIFLRGQDVSVISAKDSLQKHAMIDFTNRIFLYQLTDINRKLVDPRIASPVATYWEIDENENRVEYLIEKTCSVEKDYPDHKDLLNFDISKYKCLSRKDKPLIIEVNLSPFRNKYINFYITMCKNTTENGNHCFSMDYIQSQLNTIELYFNFYVETNGVDHRNFNAPIKASFYPEQVSVSGDFTYMYYYNWRKLIYESDKGVLFPEIDVETSFFLDSQTIKNEVYPKGTEFFCPNTVGIIQFALNAGYTEHHQRAYPKLQTLIVTIGGLFSFISKTAEIIALVSSNGLMYFHLITSCIPSINNNDRRRKSNPLFPISMTTSHKLPQIQLNQTSNIYQRPVNSYYQTNILRFPLISKKLSNKTYQKVCSNLRNRKYYFWDSILYNFCPNVTKKTQYLNACEKAIRNRLSCETLLSLMADFELLCSNRIQLNNDDDRIILHKSRQSFLNDMQQSQMINASNINIL